MASIRRIGAIERRAEIGSLDWIKFVEHLSDLLYGPTRDGDEALASPEDILNDLSNYFRVVERIRYMEKRLWLYLDDMPFNPTLTDKFEYDDQSRCS